MSSQWKMQMWTRYSAKMDQVIRQALIGAKRLGGQVFARVMQEGRQLAINGAWFLLTGDDLEGRVAMNRIASLEAFGLAAFARLCGILATLIAAAERRNMQQGAISGAAIGAEFGDLACQAARAVWRIGCPRRSVQTTRQAA